MLEQKVKNSKDINSKTLYTRSNEEKGFLACFRGDRAYLLLYGTRKERQ